MLGTFESGSLVQLTGTFRNAAGVLTDTSTAVCTVRDPAGALTTPGVSHASTGVYTANVDLTGAVAGVWRVRWSGTGTVQAADEDTFFVPVSYVLSQEP